MEVFIGRQPIFNKHEELFAYELLYRNGFAKNAYLHNDSDAATVDVLINSFLSIGMEEVTKGLPGFINFTENLLYSSVFDYLDSSKIVIEVLETVAINKKLVERLKELKKQGFKIALDDFLLDEQNPFFNELFSYTDYIKVDFLNSTWEERLKIEERVKLFSHIQLLAEKVETRQQFEVAKELGYTLFQGYFFEQPQILASTDIPINTLHYFKILELLKEQEPNIPLLTEYIEHDVSLSYNILKKANNAISSSKRRISSIKQAIMLIGLSNLRKSIYLLAMREGKTQPDTDVFKEVLYTSLFRAKVCESVALLKSKHNSPEYFLVGILSLIDTLLERPIEKILQRLPLSEHVKQTINDDHTEMTPYLRFSIALGKLNCSDIELFAKELNLTNENIENIYREATIWAESSF
ncbi:EAL and HDOD domain-containing protein [Ureibacillus composti]